MTLMPNCPYCFDEGCSICRSNVAERQLANHRRVAEAVRRRMPYPDFTQEMAPLPEKPRVRVPAITRRVSPKGDEKP